MGEVERRVRGRVATGDQDTALRAVALLNLAACDSQVDEAVGALVSKQGPDGHWRRGSYYVLPGGLGHFGSDAFSTAVAIEALSKYSRHCLRRPSDDARSQPRR